MALTVNGQNTTSFDAGSNLTVLCSALSHPPAQLRWAFRGQLVNTTGPLLQRFSVVEEQSGPYSCLAFNNHTGINSSITARIEIASEFVSLAASACACFLRCLTLVCPHRDFVKV